MSAASKTLLSDALALRPADPEIVELLSGRSGGVFDAPQQVANPSSFATSAARIGATISVNSR
jgi:hypothetical protein